MNTNVLSDSELPMAFETRCTITCAPYPIAVHSTLLPDLAASSSVVACSTGIPAYTIISPHRQPVDTDFGIGHIYISRRRINLRTRWLIIGFVDVRIMRLPERGVASTPTHVTCWTTYHDLSYIHANQRQICMTRSVRTRPVCAIVDEVRAWNWVDVQGRFREERIAVVISARCALERHLAVEDIKRKVRKIYDSMRSRYISHFDRRVKIKRHPLAESY